MTSNRRRISWSRPTNCCCDEHRVKRKEAVDLEGTLRDTRHRTRLGFDHEYREGIPTSPRPDHSLQGSDHPLKRQPILAKWDAAGPSSIRRCRAHRSDEDLRRPMVASGTNLLGMLKHLASVEYGWFCMTFGRAWQWCHLDHE
jgi:hypothetical protein